MCVVGPRLCNKALLTTQNMSEKKGTGDSVSDNKPQWQPKCSGSEMLESDIKETPFFKRMKELTGCSDDDVMPYARDGINALWRQMHPEVVIAKVRRNPRLAMIDSFLSLIADEGHEACEDVLGDAFPSLPDDVERDPTDEEEASAERQRQALYDEVVQAIKAKLEMLRLEWRG